MVPAFPLEILDLVLSFVDSRSTLATTSRCNSILAAFANRHLYRNISLDDRTMAVALTETFLSAPHLAGGVRSLSIGCNGHEGYRQRRPLQLCSPVAETRRLLSLLPNILILHLGRGSAPILAGPEEYNLSLRSLSIDYQADDRILPFLASQRELRILSMKSTFSELEEAICRPAAHHLFPELRSLSAPWSLIRCLDQPHLRKVRILDSPFDVGTITRHTGFLGVDTVDIQLPTLGKEQQIHISEIFPDVTYITIRFSFAVPFNLWEDETASKVDALQIGFTNHSPLKDVFQRVGDGEPCAGTNCKSITHVQACDTLR